MLLPFERIVFKKNRERFRNFITKLGFIRIFWSKKKIGLLRLKFSPRYCVRALVQCLFSYGKVYHFFLVKPSLKNCHLKWEKCFATFKKNLFKSLLVKPKTWVSFLIYSFQITDFYLMLACFFSSMTINNWCCSLQTGLYNTLKSWALTRLV